MPTSRLAQQERRPARPGGRATDRDGAPLPLVAFLIAASSGDGYGRAVPIIRAVLWFLMGLDRLARASWSPSYLTGALWYPGRES